MNKAIKAALAAALLLMSTEAFAQAWPNKPIKLVAPYPPGGQTDVVSRYFAEKLTAALGQQVIVENKAGAQGMVGAEIVKLKELGLDGITSAIRSHSGGSRSMVAKGSSRPSRSCNRASSTSTSGLLRNSSWILRRSSRLMPPWRMRWLRSPYPWAAVVIALLVFSPVLIWNWQHDWA